MRTKLIKFYKDRIATAYRKAENQSSKLSKFDKYIFGISSTKIKDYLNVLCDDEKIKYLEFGCFRGSTLIAATKNNSKIGVGIDNFSFNPYAAEQWREDGWPNIRMGVKDTLEKLRLDKKCKIIDCNILDDTIKLDKLITDCKFNVVFFDIDTLSKDNLLKVLNKIPALTEEIFTFVISTHNKESVRDTVVEFVKENKLATLHQEKYQGKGAHDNASWLTGIGVYVFEKTIKEEK